ncbi:MAG: hypothetical protein EZS28_047275 [Streblomastix strix]|uniref:Uncharacterized protein n=1 Tax=Streblomastix strix TaxID=222440 RepID=A0A5J4TG22_9EUKA|nr:MAG: hypothetical protein EZS28_047275 [Streblomastix strix]
MSITSDAFAQVELANVGYGRVLTISISTAGGTEEQGDQEIYLGLNYTLNFIKDFHQGRIYSFTPQHQLAQRVEEQIEAEGGCEEIDSQLINKGNGHYGGYIKDNANWAKGMILNVFIDKSNSMPFWWYW